MKEYLECLGLKQNKTKTDKCRQLSKAYLECRMKQYVYMNNSIKLYSSSGLMQQDNMENIGFPKDEFAQKTKGKIEKENEVSG